MDQLAEAPEIHDTLQAATLSLLRTVRLGKVPLGKDSYIPVDMDVSPFNNAGSHREGVGRTYKQFDGFAPIFAYIGSQGFTLAHTLRPGKQHCDRHTDHFVRQCTHHLKTIGLKEKDNVLLRLDSGNDSEDTIKALRESNYRFIVKHNLRRENPDQWWQRAVSEGEVVQETPYKKVYQGTVAHLCPGGQKSTQSPLPMVYQVTERWIDKKGQMLLIPDIKIEAYWTNTWYTPKEIIECYHEHGTSEQYHSEYKTDLNVERFPSHYFKTNQLFMAIAQLAYNLLKKVGDTAMQCTHKWPKKIIKCRRRRVASIIRDFIRVAGKITHHARKVRCLIAQHNPWTPLMLAVQNTLLANPK